MNEWIRGIDASRALATTYEHLKNHLPFYIKVNQWVTARTKIPIRPHLPIPQLHLTGYFRIKYIENTNELLATITPQTDTTVVIEISRSDYGICPLPKSLTEHAAKSGKKVLPELFGVLSLSPANSPLLWDTWVRFDDLVEFCSEFGIENIKERITSLAENKLQVQQDKAEKQDAELMEEAGRYLAEILELRDTIKHLQAENTSLKEKLISEGPTQGINPIIKTARALATLILEDGQTLGEIPAPTHIRALMTSLDGIEGAPKVDKTLRKHLTLK